MFVFFMRRYVANGEKRLDAPSCRPWDSFREEISYFQATNQMISMLLHNFFLKVVCFSPLGYRFITTFTMWISSGPCCVQVCSLLIYEDMRVWLNTYEAKMKEERAPLWWLKWNCNKKKNHTSLDKRTYFLGRNWKRLIHSHSLKNLTCCDICLSCWDARTARGLKVKVKCSCWQWFVKYLLLPKTTI